MHNFTGIDMSKDDFAVAIALGPNQTIAIRDEIANQTSGFDELVDWLHSRDARPENTTICVENAGVYSECRIINMFLVWLIAPGLDKLSQRFGGTNRSLRLAK